VLASIFLVLAAWGLGVFRSDTARWFGVPAE